MKGFIKGDDLYLDVIDHERINIETLDLSVGLGVLEEGEDGLARLLWPSTLGGGGLELFGLASSAHGSIKSGEWDASVTLDDGLEVRNGLVQVHTLRFRFIFKLKVLTC